MHIHICIYMYILTYILKALLLRILRNRPWLTAPKSQFLGHRRRGVEHGTWSVPRSSPGSWVNRMRSKNAIVDIVAIVIVFLTIVAVTTLIILLLLLSLKVAVIIMRIVVAVSVLAKLAARNGTSNGNSDIRGGKNDDNENDNTSGNISSFGPGKRNSKAQMQGQPKEDSCRTHIDLGSMAALFYTGM